MAQDKETKSRVATVAKASAMKPAFPAACDDNYGGCRPFVEIAKRWQIHENTVHDAFKGLEVPEYAAPEHLDTVKYNALELNRAARCSEKLIEILSRLPQDERDLLSHAGCVTVEQLMHLSNVLADDATYYGQFLKQRGNTRQGGRNPAAYIVAEGIRRLFRRLRKSIGYGCSDYGSPTTHFCKGVEHAIGAFGIRANWRGPAREAYEKQLEIENRRNRLLMHRHSLRSQMTNSPK